MLAGVNDHRVAPIGCLHGMIDRRDLHEVGSRGGNQVKYSGHSTFRQQIGSVLE
jgi:hypothetical protein